MMDKFQLEQATSLARIEENVNFLKQSYVEDKEKREKELSALHSRLTQLETFKDAINRKIAYIGGVLVTIGMAVPYVIDWIAARITFKGP